jgi:hypothetical protein
MAQIAKAITAALTAGASAYIGGIPGCQLDQVQHVAIGLAAAVVAGFAVWRVPNAPAPPKIAGNP